MAINKGVLTSDRTIAGDELYTPFYAVEAILKYIPKNKKIWLPFDEEWSAFNKILRAEGYDVMNTSLASGQNFFTYEPEAWDLIISNPPFSKKDEVIARVYQLNKPFMILLPLNTLQGIGRYKYFKNGVQLLAFDKRIAYHRHRNKPPEKGSPFASAYYCRDILPRDLILEKLNIDDRILEETNGV